MNELIKIQTNENGQAVSARELHEKLGIVKHFTQWWEQQTETLDLKEGKDFLPYRLESTGGRPGLDFAIPLDIAKHLTMISKGENAHAIREYFIQVEKAWNSPEMVMARSLQFAAKQIDSYKEKLVLAEAKIKELSPAADLGNAVKNNDGLIIIREYVKILSNAGIRIKQCYLFDWLVENGYLFRNGRGDYIPIKRFVEQGLFKLQETPVKTPTGSFISYTTKLTGKGQEYFIGKLRESLCLSR
jgi:anti-repressor protein